MHAVLLPSKPSEGEATRETTTSSTASTTASALPPSSAAACASSTTTHSAHATHHALEHLWVYLLSTAHPAHARETTATATHAAHARKAATAAAPPCSTMLRLRLLRRRDRGWQYAKAQRRHTWWQLLECLGQLGALERD